MRPMLRPILAGFLIACGSVQAASAQNDAADASDDVVIGYLAWNAGEGTIAWSEPATSEDPGGSQTELDEFASAPLPRPAYMNASRPIVVELLAATVECQRFGPIVELWLGTKLVASSRGGGIVGGQEPSPPVGYCLNWIRIHPEVDTIPADATLTLKVFKPECPRGAGGRYWTGSSCVNLAPGQARIAMGPGHRSLIRIPVYTPEEIVLRVPQFANAPRPEGGGSLKDAVDEAAGALIASLVGAAPLLAVRRPSAKRSQSLAFILLIGTTLGMAGCTSSPNSSGPDSTAPATGGSATAREILDDQNATGLAGLEVGSIVGQVSDEFRRPVTSAHVVLAGFAITQTDGAGKFAFKNIVARAYDLRVNKTGFLDYRSEIVVKNATVTTLQIQLDSAVRATGDATWHPHDYWSGRDSVDLHKDTFVFRTGNLVGGQANACFQAWMVLVFDNQCQHRFVVPHAAHDDDLIKPGTVEVEVVVSWDNAASSSVDHAKVGFQANNERPYYDAQRFLRQPNFTWMSPRGSGEPTHIRTGWEMTDVGHQIFSTWIFEVRFVLNDGAEYAVDAEFEVAIRIHRGVVPLEPAHRDFWEGRDERVVLQDASVVLPAAPGGLGVIGHEGAFDADDPGLYSAHTTFFPTKLTPPDTKWLDVEAEVNETAGPSVPWRLFYKTAATPPSTWSFQNPDYRPVTGTRSGGVIRFTVPVEPGEEDSFYAATSGWAFVLEDGQDTPVTPVDPDSTSAYKYTEYSFKIDIVAHRDDRPAA